MARNIPVLADEVKRQKLLELISEGKGLKGGCEVLKMDRSAVFQYRRKDDVFDGQYRSAMVAGAEIALEDAEHLLNAAGTRDEILKGKELLRHAQWKAEKLLVMYQPKQKMEVEHSGPMVIGWQDGGQVCPRCGHSMHDAGGDIVVIDQISDGKKLSERI